jgi:polysaccharide biosynthesis protein PslG
MQSPFWQHVRDLFTRLTGRTLVAAGIVWVLLMTVGLSCALGVIDFPGRRGDAPGGVSARPTPTTDPFSPGATTPQPGATATVGGGLVLPTPTPTPPASVSDLPPLPWGDFGYGIAAHAIGMPDYTMDQIKNHLGLSWVKQQVRWDHFSTAPGQMDWSGYDAMVLFAAERELKVMMSVVGAPEWSRSYFDSNPEAAPPDDLSLFVNFVGEMVDRYKGRIHAIEVWNEQNLDREWDTEEGVDAARYVEMLRLSYQAIKSRDPNIIVISGALSPTGVVATDDQNPNRCTVIDDFIYFKQMIDAGFLNYADCVGAHHNGYNLPPDVAWDDGYNNPEARFRGPFDSPHHSWSFKSTLWGYHDMIRAAQRDTPLCVTEFGWASSEGFDGTPVGFEFADDISLEDQARWNVEAFQLMRQWGFVHLAFLWNLDYSYKGGLGAADPNAPYSILDLRGAARPAYSAVGDMAKIP